MCELEERMYQLSGKAFCLFCREYASNLIGFLLIGLLRREAVCRRCKEKIGKLKLSYQDWIQV